MVVEQAAEVGQAVTETPETTVGEVAAGDPTAESGESAAAKTEQADTQQTDTQQTDTQQTDTQQTDTQQADTQQTDTQQQTRSRQTRSRQTRSRQTRSWQTRSWQICNNRWRSSRLAMRKAKTRRRPSGADQHPRCVAPQPAASRLAGTQFGASNPHGDVGGRDARGDATAVHRRPLWWTRRAELVIIAQEPASDM